MSTWVVIGSAPSVVDHFDSLMQRYQDATTITANGGLSLFKAASIAPDYFVLLDEYAAIHFMRQVAWAVAVGSKYITMEHSTVLSATYVDVPRPSQVLHAEVEHRTNKFIRGKIVNAQFSGLLAMQFALVSGATRLILAGCDGYKGSYPLRDFPTATFDGRDGDSFGSRYVGEIIMPFMRSMVAESPDVEFVQYGEPLFAIDAPNYTLHTTAEVV